MNTIICYFLGHYCQAVILWQYASSLFSTTDKNQKTKFLLSYDFQKGQAIRRILVLTYLYFILFLVSVMELRWLNVIMFLLVNYVYLLTQYRLKSFLSLFHSSVLTAVMSACELFLYSVVSRYSPHFFAESSYFHNLVILTVSSNILNFLIIHIIIYFIKGKKTDNTSQTFSTLLLSLIPITSIIVMITYVDIGEKTFLPSESDWMIALSAILLLCINLLVFGLNLYNQKKHSEYTETLLLLQKESDTAKYYEMLLSQYDNRNILIHDIKKHLQSIDLLNDKRDHEKISAYIKQLLLSSDLRTASKLCDHALLNAILGRYQKQCFSLHVSFLADIRSGVLNFMAENDITSLFCNLLDNAVEACKNIPDSFIEVTAHKNENTPYVVITVINSCRSDPFSTPAARRTRHKPTAKPDAVRHGFGLKSIRKTIAKYDGDIEMYYSGDTLTFHSVIMLTQVQSK